MLHTPLVNVRDYFPELARAVDAYDPFLSKLVDPFIVALCRLRIAQIVGASDTDVRALSAAALAVGVSNQQLADVPNWFSSDRFDAAQKSCLELAEYFCYTSESVTDEHIEQIAAHLSSEQIFGLTIALWVTDSCLRMSNFLEIIAHRESVQ